MQVTRRQDNASSLCFMLSSVPSTRMCWMSTHELICKVDILNSNVDFLNFHVAPLGFGVGNAGRR